MRRSCRACSVSFLSARRVLKPPGASPTCAGATGTSRPITPSASASTRTNTVSPSSGCGGGARSPSTRCASSWRRGIASRASCSPASSGRLRPTSCAVCFPPACRRRAAGCSDSWARSSSRFGQARPTKACPQSLRGAARGAYRLATWSCCRAPDLALVDVPLGLDRRAASRGLARDQHQALELGHQHPILVEHARVHLDRAPVGLRPRLFLLELLEEAPVGMRAAGLAGSLVGLDRLRVAHRSL